MAGYVKIVKGRGKFGISRIHYSSDDRKSEGATLVTKPSSRQNWALEDFMGGGLEAMGAPAFFQVEL